MIAASPLAKGVAAVAAVALHGAVVASLFSGEEALIEGGTPGVEASPGDSFADLATGVMTAQTPKEPVQDAATPQRTERIAPGRVVTAQSATETPRIVPEMAQTARVEAKAIAPAPADDVLLAARAPDDVEKTALTSVRRLATSPDGKVAPAQDASPAVNRSLRPKTRSAAFEAAHKPAPRKAAAPRPEDVRPKTAKAIQPKGNAKQSTKTGTATGRKTAPAAGSQGASKKAALGNAAAGNYPGVVLKKISKVARPRVGSKGTAVVAFRIAPSGALAAVSLARSSGSTRLDQAALTVIRQAAPFPPPPPGARRSFSINVQGR